MESKLLIFNIDNSATAHVVGGIRAAKGDPAVGGGGGRVRSVPFPSPFQKVQLPIEHTVGITVNLL